MDVQLVKVSEAFKKFMKILGDYSLSGNHLIKYLKAEIDEETGDWILNYSSGKQLKTTLKGDLKEGEFFGNGNYTDIYEEENENTSDDSTTYHEDQSTAKKEKKKDDDWFRELGKTFVGL